eukprot:CAMPEP_0174735584 /NCGR_PEP_ID=MMETSP1094-20130205/65213_1 /TAXON_ID=156173 /ORGANISM="Chrysochromulina brevifilum, Strain UTEX LB 985" /LENGTH=78 /DNA_ID=CAMNT_0015938567 /DNA_START=296 /DNA_END=529 /DNA_ORIENTATION=+
MTSISPAGQSTRQPPTLASPLEDRVCGSDRHRAGLSVVKNLASADAAGNGSLPDQAGSRQPANTDASTLGMDLVTACP